MVAVSGRRRSIIFFSVLGISLVAVAIALNISWVVLNWRAGVMFVLGILFFLVIIGGLGTITFFLIREIRRNDQHDQFINSMTHELKTPVASIRLYLETLQRRDLDSSKRQEFYRVMLDDSDRLLHTIDQVLRAGRVGRSSRLHNKTRVDLSEVIQECVELARTRNHLPAECISVTALPGSRDPVAVLGDPDELKGAVMNLLDNAIKYSGERIDVRVGVERLGNDAVIRVSDSGIGIPKDELKNVFKRFYRVPGTVTIRVKGTGLGLFIVRSVVEKHGGKIIAESEGAGKGTTFKMRLPLAANDAIAQAVAT